MKIIIYLTSSELAGIEIRIRTSEKPVFHLLESTGFDTIEDAYNYADCFARGAEAAGAETTKALDECLEDMNVNLDDELPIYHQAMKSQDFDTAWESIQ